MARSAKKNKKEKKQHKDIIKNYRFGALIFVFAFFIRLLYLLQVKNNVLIQSPISDCYYYFHRATEILKGNFIAS